MQSYRNYSFLKLQIAMSDFVSHNILHKMARRRRGPLFEGMVIKVLDIVISRYGR